jgi:hypothetical protein
MPHGTFDANFLFSVETKTEEFRDSRDGKSRRCAAMTLKKKILAGAFALAIGSSVAIPTTARADWWADHDRDHHAWVERQHHDHWDRNSYYRDQRQRDYDWDHHDWYSNHPNDSPSYGPNYSYYPNRQRNLPANGEGMISARNPNLHWACDSEGHHCHWARR